MSTKLQNKPSVNYAHALLASERQERIEDLLSFGRELLFLSQEPPTEGFKLRVKQEAARRFRVSDATSENYALTVVTILRGQKQ